MVHALEEIHRLLTPDGRLIDIHPVREAPLIKVLRRGAVMFSEPAPDHDGDDYRHADAAVANVVRRGLFAVEHRTEFDFVTHAASIAELQEYLEESNAYEHAAKDQSRAAQDAAVARRVEQVMRASGRGATVVHQERTQIARLKPIR
ncbi:MAG: hypothetical protein ACRDFT_00305 [bacterium]